MPSDDRQDDWSIGDIWLGLLFLVTGCTLTGLAVLTVRSGRSGAILLTVGVGGFLIGPALILIGGNAVVRALWSVRTRSYHEVLDDQPAQRSGFAADVSSDGPRFGADLEEPRPPEEPQDR
jgi:hypothetical protein